MNPELTPPIALRTLAVLLAGALILHGQTLNTLLSFGHNKLGYDPESGVTIGPKGQLYGTTPFGGDAGLGCDGGRSGCGVVYELLPPTPPSAAWTEAVLHSFSASDGQPAAGLLLGQGGLLFGVTPIGGAYDAGTVFALKPPASPGAHWPEAILYNFTNSNGDGDEPEATPVLGPDGAIYGATSAGGSVGGGAVYRLAPPSAQGGAWAEQVLYSFPGYPGDGTQPIGPLAIGIDGTIYGATEYGGAGTLGTIFQLTPPATPGGTWTESLLYSFGSNWAYPNGVVPGPGGVLYGTAMGNKDSRECLNSQPCGTVFQLSPPEGAGGDWILKILHVFHGDAAGDGSQPNSAPVLGPGGVLYGTTGSGGTIQPSLGTIYEMVPPSSPGGSWSEVILYSFPEDEAEGDGPNAVTLGPDGNLYGTTALGGAHGVGTVFQLVLQ
jgi:uncharacterized repeat protein (TIGR03803 family)